MLAGRQEEHVAWKQSAAATPTATVKGSPGDWEGGAEFAGPENVGPQKNNDWKLQHLENDGPNRSPGICKTWKMKDQIAGAGKYRTWKMTDFT